MKNQEKLKNLNNFIETKQNDSIECMIDLNLTGIDMVSQVFIKDSY